MIGTCTISDLDLYRPGTESAELERRWGCSPLAAAVLSCRGISTSSHDELFQNPSLPDLVTPLFLGESADLATRLWNKAIAGKRVLVHGDYDVDGISSTVIALRLCQLSGASQVRYYIPHREKEGYGLNTAAVEHMIAAGVETLVVTDCGSRDVEPIARARAAGLTVLVFDHHLVEGVLSEPQCLVNPQIDGDDTSRQLCATSVLWCWACQSGLFPAVALKEFLQLVALATVSDCMPLNDLNRGLIREGLAQIGRNPCNGLRELMSALALEPAQVDETDLAMKIIPCLNAAGRLYVADLAVDVVAGFGNLRENVERLIHLNQRRRDISTQICTAINRRLATDDQDQVMYDGQWPVGILSAIASRLCQEHRKGFALAAPSGSGIRGTLRVPDGANAVELLKELDDHLAGWGGHRYAAGFSVSHDRWPRVSLELGRLLSQLEIPEFREDAILFNPENIDLSDWKDVLKLGPFGNGNPAPSFFVPSSGDVHYEPLGKRGLHLKVRRDDRWLIVFNGAKQVMEMENIAGWIYKPRLNFWRGRAELQFIVGKIVTTHSPAAS